MATRICIVAVLIALGVSCSPEKKAAKNFKYGKYNSVIIYYRGLLAKDPENKKANYMVAESYRLSNRIRESEPYYAKAGGRGVNPDSVRLYYSRALRANGKYDEAQKVLNQIEENAENDGMKAVARKELDGLSYLQTLATKKSYYKVRNLEALNTTFAEYDPVYLNGELYFSSNRGQGRVYEATGAPFSDLYKVATKGAVVDVASVEALGSLINDALINEGCITFSPDGKIMVFGKGNSGRRKDGYDVDLYMSRFRNGTWTAPTPINVNTVIKEGDPASTNYSWDSTPCFSPDGRTLYFSSNRKGGFGGTDLYSAQMDSRGRFGKVRNLGPDINTPGDDMFPYVADNGKLYFASDGHPGYGMLDLFVVNRANGRTVVENLGQPMNSTGDDFGLFLFKPDRGFFTSNRDGGKGDDDIYTFINEDPNLRVINYYLEGITYTIRKDSSRQILPETKVTLYDAKGNVMQDYTTGNDGKFLFRVYENENYTIMGEADGYLTKRESYTTLGKGVAPETLKELVTNITLDTVLYLDRKAANIAYRLKNIEFGYDSSNIRTQSARELDNLVNILNDNPEIKIEMGSHTDSIASDEYNISLSQRRAEATRQYLISKGISPDRIKARGYGERVPIARNTNPDGTDNPEGRQRNRRTEFRILEIGPPPEKKDELDDDEKYFKDEK